MGFTVDELNHIQVTPEDMRTILNKIESIRNPDAAKQILTEIFGCEKKAAAVACRYQALWSLVTADLLPETAYIAGNRELLAKPVWERSATAPILAKDGYFYFDKDTFLEGTVTELLSTIISSN